MNRFKREHKAAAAAIMAIIAGSLLVSRQLTAKPQLDSVAIATADITQGVASDGLVKAAQDLGLAFENGGTVAKVNVKTGDKVKKGQVLVELDNRGLSATLNQAAASVQASQAAYNKLINGATDQDVAVAQVALQNQKTALDNTIKQQQVIVDNAYKTLLNSGLAAIPDSGNAGAVTVTITGAYDGKNQGSYKITFYTSGNGMQFQYSGLESGSGLVDTAPQPLGTKGLFIQFSTTAIPVNNGWTVNLPNTQSGSYVTNNNAYQTALQNQKSAVDAAQSAVNSAQAALDLKTTKPRPEDIAASTAQMNVVQAQYQLAQNSYNHSQLIAPIDGIITSVDAKVGQTVAGSTLAPGIPAIKMISDQKFQVETYVAETEIGKIKIGDQANITLDAYSPDNIFPAEVIGIDPAAAVIKGVSAYKVTLQFHNEDSRILSGMGANIAIFDEKHSNVLAVPKNSVLNDNGKTYVLVKTADGQFKKTEIKTGMIGVEGQVEILSGLSQGQWVASLGN